MASPLEAYLDIETTGLSCYSRITVVGVYLENGSDGRFLQLVGDGVAPENLLKALDGADSLFTYNGTSFDLRLIKANLGVDLAQRLRHYDLMYDCWQNNLYGGLKAVEKQLGLPRKLKDMNGYQAVLLWQRYQRYEDYDALAKLLEYNKEDVLNLKYLKNKLFGRGRGSRNRRNVPSAHFHETHRR